MSNLKRSVSLTLMAQHSVRRESLAAELLCSGDNADEMSLGSSSGSYPAFARIVLRENQGRNLNQVTCPDRDSNPGHLVSRPDALAVTPQKLKYVIKSNGELILDTPGLLKSEVIIKLINTKSTGANMKRKTMYYVEPIQTVTVANTATVSVNITLCPVITLENGTETITPCPGSHRLSCVCYSPTGLRLEKCHFLRRGCETSIFVYTDQVSPINRQQVNVIRSSEKINTFASAYISQFRSKKKNSLQYVFPNSSHSCHYWRYRTYRSGLSANDDSGYNCSANDRSAFYRYKTASSYGLATSMWTSVPRKNSIISRLRTSHNIRDIAPAYLLLKKANSRSKHVNQLFIRPHLAKYHLTECMHCAKLKRRSYFMRAKLVLSRSGTVIRKDGIRIELFRRCKQSEINHLAYRTNSQQNEIILFELNVDITDVLRGRIN
ncbi:hypothetical protein ANN_25186 [Periplaneta americana]|uniref:Phlebovirus glycoprotein G2 fusion domain-containing protein n=1 Tax=Periplaneta americana TaxID=6978 RepID=A0ABQ8S0N0_PERAM|nr:hypothetical protein ANN_25186 [Periplaneta americana]